MKMLERFRKRVAEREMGDTKDQAQEMPGAQKSEQARRIEQMQREKEAARERGRLAEQRNREQASARTAREQAVQVAKAETQEQQAYELERGQWYEFISDNGPEVLRYIGDDEQGNWMLLDQSQVRELEGGRSGYTARDLAKRVDSLEGSAHIDRAQRRKQKAG